MGIGSFFKGLGKGLLRAAPIVAAPFTGGASLALSPLIEGASKALGSGAQAAASNRGTKAEMMMDQNSDLERQLLAREQEKRAAQGQAYRAAMMGERGQSWKPLQRPPGIPGSYAGLTDQSKGVSAELFKQAMARLNAPDLQGPQGMPAYNDLTKNKQFQKTLNPGIWEKIAGVGSAVLPLAGGIMGGGPKRSSMAGGILSSDDSYS